MRPDAANSWTGKAVNPDNGSIYSGKMFIEGPTLQHLGLHHRWIDLQVGELEKGTLASD